MALLLSLGAQLAPAARDREKALGRVHVGSRGLVGGRERSLEGHAAVRTQRVSAHWASARSISPKVHLECAAQGHAAREARSARVAHSLAVSS